MLSKRLDPNSKMLLATVLFSASGVFAQTPLSSSLTYQGRLSLDGSSVNETADFQFSLWDAATNGSAVGSVITVEDYLVVDGLFTVELDFGVMALNGDARWLEVAVRSPAGSGIYTVLSNRQSVTAAPYASYAIEAGQVTGGITGIGTTGTLPKFSTGGELGDSVVTESNGNIGVGVPVPQNKLVVDGVIESVQGGVRFPDGTIQSS